MSRHSHSPVNAYSRFPSNSAALSPTRSNGHHLAYDEAGAAADMVTPMSARSSRSFRARERERGRDHELDAELERDRDLVYVREGEVEARRGYGYEYDHDPRAGNARDTREGRYPRDSREPRTRDPLDYPHADPYHPTSSAAYHATHAPSRGYGHEYDRDDRAREVRARRQEEYGDFDPHRERRRYGQADDVDWRNEPASPQRALPPLSSIAPSLSNSNSAGSASGGGGSRMALSSLLDSAPGPAAGAHTRVSGSIAGGTTSPPAAPSSALEADKPARQSGRNPHSLEYEPVQSSQVFYGAPPGYAGGSTRHGHDSRTRGGGLGGLTPSYAAAMYDNGLYDDRDRARERDMDVDREGRLENARARAHGLDGRANGHGYYSSRHGGNAMAPSYSQYDHEGSRSPPIIPANLLPGDPRLPPIPPSTEAYESSRAHDARMNTSPPSNLGCSGYSRTRRETRQSASTSPMRMTGHAEAGYAEPRRGSEFDGYATSASAAAATGHGAGRGHPLDGDMMVAAPASARERERAYAYHRAPTDDRRQSLTSEAPYGSSREYALEREYDDTALGRTVTPRTSRQKPRRYSRAEQAEMGIVTGHSPNGRVVTEADLGEDGMGSAGQANGNNHRGAIQSPSKAVAYKLSDMLDESKEVWEEELKVYQQQREREAAEIAELDLEAIHAEMLKIKPTTARSKARSAKPAASTAAAQDTPETEPADLPDVKPVVPKGRKGAQPRASTGGKAKGGKGRNRKSAVNAEIEDELLGLAEGDDVAATSVVAPSSPPIAADEDEAENDRDAAIPDIPDPDSIVLPCGLPRREVIRRVAAQELDGLTDKDVKAVQDEIWHKEAEAKGSELARTRDGRIKKKPGPAKGWKKLKGEDGVLGSGTKRKKDKDVDAPSSMRGSDDEDEGRGPASEIGLEDGAAQELKINPEEDDDEPEIGEDPDAEAAIGALLDEPEPPKPSKSEARRKKRKIEAQREQGVMYDEDEIAGAFGPIPIPGASALQLDDAASDRRSSIADFDEDHSVLLPSKRKSGKSKAAATGSKKGKKGKEKDIGPALSGGPLTLPTAFGSHPDASFADDISNVPRDDAGFYDAFGAVETSQGQGSTDLPPPHAPLHFNVTPKGSDTNSLPLPPDGGFEEYLVPAPVEIPKPAKAEKGKEVPVVKATNVDDPRGVSVEEAHARLAVVEELQKNVWTALVKDIPRVYRVMQGFDSANKQYKLRTAQACLRNAQRASKNAKSAAMVKKDATTKAKKAVREMLVYWRKNEKDELLARKKSEKEALEKAKQEEEHREAKRQERKLHFLLTQTELYSHFIGKKIKTADAERPDDETGDGDGDTAPMEGEDKHADVEGLDGEHEDDLPDLDYDEDDEANLRKHAARGAAAHARAAREKAAQFDQQRAQKAANGDVDLKGVDLDGDELNFQEPSLGANSVTITQPKILMAQLKEYQLKGLTWLGNLYEQGINGILADEMGLGKTIQSISLLAYLAEQHNLWGPFLVITPVSTLHNWMQEIARFVPALNVIPYWGQPKDREVLRSIWCKRHATYDKDSRFHVLVTSYQMAVQDEKYLSSLRWQYMILDEAQAIKSSSSMRWTTLLGLPCRNRLLLTGTPIQNSMQELWALLHFIMPTLFDSHEEFSEWFSKDIEKTAASGNTGNLQPEQLKRLHMILKPFMLRRVKKHVQKELGEKIEIDVMVDMSQRQKTLYRALRQRVSISDLLAQASSLNDSAGTKHLMNLVMQFRKVCSHPDLFERADVVSPFFFGTFSQSGRTTKEGDNMYCPASGRNAIAPTLPRLVWEDKVDRPKEESNAGDKRWILNNMMSIWNPDWVAKRLKEEQQRDDGYGFLRFTDQTPATVAKVAKGHPLVQLVSNAESNEDAQNDGAYEGDSAFAAAKPSKRFTVPPRIPLAELEHDTPLKDISNIAWNRSVLSRKASRFAIDAAAAAPIRPIISSRSYVSEAAASQADPLITRALYGVAPSERNDPYAVRQLHNLVPGISPNGLLAAAPQDQVPRASLNVPPIKRLIVDSAKLARLDELLRELKDGGHRVLLYFQMTKMMDLVEEYLIFRQHKYLRLDGTTVLEERRDMVNSWQTNPEIFVFCLSTRAGGLGINLTAADTVIFYDHDWNPSNDAQAMDRAHRVGQTKQVTVYRLITRNTIEERIVRMARAKKDVQDIVVGTKSLNDVAKPSEIASLFMDDEELAESVAKRKQAEAHGYVAPAPGRQQRKSTFGDGLGGMDDDEDDFFSSGPQKGANNEDEDFGDVDGNQQGGNAAGIVGNGPAGAPDGKKKSGGSKKKKTTATTAGAGAGGASGAATPAEGDTEKKKGGGTKRKAGEGETGDAKKKKKVKIVQPDEGTPAPADASAPAE